MPSSRKKAKSRDKIKDFKAAAEEEVSEEDKEQPETCFIQSHKGGRLTSPSTFFGENGEEFTYKLFVTPE